MPPTIPEDDELFRFGEVAFDVASIYGVTTEQGLKRARRAINRAMISILGGDRNWSWRRTKDSFMTVAGTREYSMQPDVRADISHFWMEGANRGIIRRIPTGQFVKHEPDANLTTGIPRLFDYEGVDSSGCVIISFYPIPPSVLEIFFRFTKEIKPINDESKSLKTYWGLPQNMLEPLTQKAAALCLQGANNARFMELNGYAELLIETAYSADQSRKNTLYRAPLINQIDRSFGDVRLPAEFSED